RLATHHDRRGRPLQRLVVWIVRTEIRDERRLAVERHLVVRTRGPGAVAAPLWVRGLAVDRRAEYITEPWLALRAVQRAVGQGWRLTDGGCGYRRENRCWNHCVHDRLGGLAAGPRMGPMAKMKTARATRAAIRLASPP